MPTSSPSTNPPATGAWRLLYLITGFGCVGLAYLGWVLPGLPVTPWVILASVCFGKSSPRLQRWLLRSPVFGKLLRDWHEHRGIRRPVKLLAVVLVVLVCGSSVLFAPVPIWVRWVIGCCGAVGVCVILFVVPTVTASRDPGSSGSARGG